MKSHERKKSERDWSLRSQNLNISARFYSKSFKWKDKKYEKKNNNKNDDVIKTMISISFILIDSKRLKSSWKGNLLEKQPKKYHIYRLAEKEHCKNKTVEMTMIKRKWN